MKQPGRQGGGLFKGLDKQHTIAMQLFTPACPRCTKGLQRNGETLSCSECGAVFPLRNSIVDFLQPFALPDRRPGWPAASTR